MLTFWCDTDEKTFQQLIKDRIDALDPPVQYRWVRYQEGVPLLPEVGELVVAMGQDCLDEIKKVGGVAKNRSLTSLRSKLHPRKVFEADGTTVQGFGHWMLSFSPNSTYVDAANRSNIRWDVALAHRYYTTGSLEPPVGEYAWADDLSAIVAYVEQKHAETGKPVPVSIDLETEGLVSWFPDKDIVTVQASAEIGYSDVCYVLEDCKKGETPRLRRIIQQLRWLLTSEKVITTGANFKYDLGWLRVKWGLTSTNFKMDTLLVGTLLDENRSNSLKQHAKDHTEMGGYEEAFEAKYPDKGKMGDIPKDEPLFLTYTGGDTDSCLRVAQYQRKELQVERRLQRFYLRLLLPAARAFESIEHRGLCVDLQKYGELEKRLQKEIKETEAAALAMMPARLRAKFSDNLTLSRPALLGAFFFSDMGMNLKAQMFTPKTGVPQTNKAHFMMFEDHPVAGPFIELYKRWGSASKTLGTYCHGFLNHLRPDGRFHPTYMLFNGSAFEGKDDDGGTDTGRSSAIDPAVQTIPKHTVWADPLRECFPAPPGYRFFQADFSQGELRISACVANETNMLDAYRSGKDLHCVTGAQLGGYELDEFMAMDIESPKTDAEKKALSIFKMFRQRAKPANFGLLYGMGAEGFREFCRVSYKLILSAGEAEAVRDAFFALYAGLVRWHGESKTFAKQNGYVISPLGRIAHLPLINSKIGIVRSKAERKAINSPIQSCLSDLCMWAISILEERYAADGLWISGMTHDSIYGYVPEDDWEMWLSRIVEVMDTLPYRETFDWHPALDSFPADIEVGSNMADLKKYKLAA